MANKTFLQYLAAPIKAMGFIKAAAAVVPATLAIITFTGAHDPILVGLGLRESPEDRWATIEAAARCGSANLNPVTGRTEIKVCDTTISGLTFDSIVPTKTPLIWQTRSHHSMVRFDCPFVNISFTVRFEQQGGYEFYRVEQSNLAVMSDDGTNAEFAAQWTLPALAPQEAGFEGSYRLTWDCPEGQIVEIGDWVKTEIPKDHIWDRS